MNRGCGGENKGSFDSVEFSIGQTESVACENGLGSGIQNAEMVLGVAWGMEELKNPFA